MPLYLAYRYLHTQNEEGTSFYSLFQTFHQFCSGHEFFFIFKICGRDYSKSFQPDYNHFNRMFRIGDAYLSAVFFQHIFLAGISDFAVGSSVTAGVSCMTSTLHVRNAHLLMSLPK